MDIQSFSAIDIAIRQIHTAIELFLNAKDPFSVITLAGAGEEILGHLVEKKGKEHVLERMGRALIEIDQALNKEQPTLYKNPREAKKRLNLRKNLLKHTNHCVELDPLFEAESMLYRSLENYHALTGGLTQNMLDFLEKQSKRNDIVPSNTMRELIRKLVDNKKEVNLPSRD